MQNEIHIGRINTIGIWTLYKREVWRFLKVYNQTVFAPVVTTMLFLAIFSLALGGSVRLVGKMPFIEFIAPGLIMMAIVQNSFANTSSSLMLSKIQGVIIDVLMPPFRPSEMVFAAVMGGVTRGVVVGSVTAVAMVYFVPFSVHSPWLVLFYVVASSMMMALFGMVGGLWAQSFDQMSMITNYVITPLAFLSGTFYSVKQLPEVWQVVSRFDPFFYMIDGFRYAVTGFSDGNISLGIGVMIVMNILLWVAATQIIRSGWRLKS